MHEIHLKTLFEKRFGQQPLSIEHLSRSGSNRNYYRLSGADFSVIGTAGTSAEENKAFITHARHFAAKGLSVPEVYAVSDDWMYYLQSDLGSVSLFDFVAAGRTGDKFSQETIDVLMKTMRALARIQFEGAEGMDFSVCYPLPEFDSRSIMFDLNYFKYCFLKTSGIEFDEVRLEQEFEKMRDDLLAAGKTPTFMYRDFQARNVMVVDGEPYFIDFQGGRKGPVYYDVASFVWQAKARYPKGLRHDLINAYLGAMKEFMDVDEAQFNVSLRLFVLFRLLQVLGAYGFRGYTEKKPHFLESIPYAIDNLKTMLKRPFRAYPYLNEVLNRLVKNYETTVYVPSTDGKLHIDVWSFSYKKGIPDDNSGNGGGFVFDCRGMNNPGRYDFYKKYTGLDQEVIKFLEDDGAIIPFLEHAKSMVVPHAANFVRRGFSHMTVCFGCTGGQHRSVYCAQHMAEHLVELFGDKVVVRVIHREQEIVSLF